MRKKQKNPAAKKTAAKKTVATRPARRKESEFETTQKPTARKKTAATRPAGRKKSEFETTQKPAARKKTAATRPAGRKSAGKKPSATKEPAPDGSALTVGQLVEREASKLPPRTLAPRSQASSPPRAPARARPPANPRSPAKRLRRLVGDIASAVGRATGLSPRRPSVPLVVRTSPGSDSCRSAITGTTVEPPAQTKDDEPKTGEEIEAFFMEDYTEKGDGRDSDVEGDLINLHHEALLLNQRGEEQLLRDKANNIDAEEEGVVGNRIPGAPDGWDPPSAPRDYEPEPPKYDAPKCFEDVDNPGSWSPFTFRPRYCDKKYLGHFSPSGAQVVPKNADGRRVITNDDGEEWEFFYNS